MTAGITIYNSSGTIQIDETYRNMLLASKGTSTGTTISGITYPLISFASTNFVTAYGAAGSGSATYTLSQAANWWVWDVRNPPASNAGLQIFNGSGQLVFDSSYKPMRIVDHRTFNAPSEWVGLTLTYPAGPVYSVALSLSPSRRTAESLNKGPDGWEIQYTDYRLGARIINNVITFNWVMTNQYIELDDHSQDWTRDYSLGCQVLIVDVTNI